MHPANEVAYFVYEREKIRQLHDAGSAKEWTTDPILKQYRFCNVNREDDRVTRWIAKYWRNPNADHPNLAVAMLLARMINWPPTLEHIGFPHKWHPTMIEARIHELADHGYKVWSSAYIVSTCGRRMDKATYVVWNVCDALYQRGAGYPTGATLESVWTALRAIDGLGAGFLAAQVVADLKNTPDHPLQKAKDWWTWAVPGPGSKRGLQRYFGHPVNVAGFLGRLNQMREQVEPILATSVQPLCNQNWQNVMCEMDKYWRVQNGEGRPRQNYTPEINYQV